MAENGENQLAEATIRGNNFREHLKKTAGNFEFQHRISQVLKELMQGHTKLRILDYGAGTPAYVTLASTIQQGQETVAYDPCYEGAQIEEESGIRWTKNPPVNEEFDLTICHFSLHHTNKPLKKTLKELRGYSPIIAVVDYDFKKATLAEFEKVFISELEQKELRIMFGEDWEKCFGFHSRYGLSTYKSALRKNDFDTASEFGKDIAKHKFLLIGIRHSPLSKLVFKNTRI